METKEYTKPELIRVGPFRELTQSGSVGNCGDPFTVSSPDFECLARS